MSVSSSDPNARIRVIVADDEALARERLRHFLADEPDVEIVGECADGGAALECIRSMKPLLAFLDVRMPVMSGLEVVRNLGPGGQTLVVFVTAHDEYAVQAFEAHAVDYLLKPFDRERFQATLQRVRSRLNHPISGKVTQNLLGLIDDLKDKSRQPGRVAVRSAGRVTMVQLTDVEWVCGAGNYIELHAGAKVHLLRRTMTEWEAEAGAHDFMRISRSFMVNIAQVREVKSKSHGDYLVVMRSGKELVGSRNYRDFLHRSGIKRAKRE